MTTDDERDRHDPVAVTARWHAARAAHPEPADPAAVDRLWRVDALPRSARYDPGWLYRHHMGPNVLWLTESLTQVLDLRPGQRVLDLGCGTALSSIFLAGELGVRVWAADLWIAPGDNWRRIVEAGLEDLVTPLSVEAHALPFATGFFDAVVSIDAYQYFGAEETYLPTLVPLLQEGGTLGVVVPTGGGEEFHPLGWWRDLWAASPAVDLQRAEPVPDDRALWERHLALLEAWEGSDETARIDRAYLDADPTLGLARLVAGKALLPEASNRDGG
jgi:SAM-dependent methyltransferase